MPKGKEKHFHMSYVGSITDKSAICMEENMDTSMELPIICETEYVILGGGIRELKEAIRLASKNKKVLLVVRECYLAYEICSTCRYTFPYAQDKRKGYFNELFPPHVQEETNNKEDLVVLHPDRFKLHLEEICKQKGISLLYNAAPLEVIVKEDNKLVKIAGKFGVNGILCKECITFSNNYDSKENNCYSIYLLGIPKDITVSLEKIQIEEEEFYVSIRKGAFSEEHGLLEIPVKQHPSRDRFLCEAKERALKAVDYLKKSEQYAGIRIGYFGLDGYLAETQIEDFVEETDAPFPFVSLVNRENIKLSSNNRMLQFPNYPVIRSETAGAEPKQYDIVVAGGGTAGVMAAIYGARLGCRVVLLEMNQDLGGTGTVGGVSTYWFGKRFFDVLEVDKKIQDIYDTYGMQRNSGIWSEYDDYHSGIRSLVLTRMCMEAGVTIVYGALSYGAAIDNGLRVHGVAVVSEMGPETYFGAYVADATGDGDIAAFAGAEETYGSYKDCITYWGSLAQYSSPDKYKNNFSSALVVADPWDYTRFILVGRRRGESTFDHGSYVSPRESRHIKGQYEVNLKDIVSLRTYEDGIYTCFSNYDPKGKVSADMVYAGVLPPQVSIQIPLRALLPVTPEHKPIEGIAVLGKAISCTHNAFPSIRMQPDLMHQGSIMGILMAEAVKNQVSLTEIDKKKREMLIYSYTRDNLCLSKAECFQAVDKLNINSRTHWVDIDFTEEVQEIPETIAVMTADSKEILPLLKKKYKDAMTEQEKIMLAKYLLWHGDDSKSKIIIYDILNTLNECSDLPIRSGSTMCVQLLPDHGVMPELVYQLNLLAYSKDEELVEPFKIVLSRLKKMNRDYLDNKKGIYHYIESFTYLAERTGRDEFIPMLLDIEKFEEFSQVFIKENDTALLTERHMILLSSIYRAMARCGEICGYYGLIHLLLVDSLPIAASAKMELDRLLKKDNLATSDEFKAYIESSSFKLEKQRITEKIW